MAADLIWSKVGPTGAPPHGLRITPAFLEKPSLRSQPGGYHYEQDMTAVISKTENAASAEKQKTRRT
jgi:hypothetical protein